MKKMRITNIDIKNYRQYQSLSFSFPKSNVSDIHIIVAQNGVGKTNLLNAITWCLYGKEPHLGLVSENIKDDKNENDNKNNGLPKLNLTAADEAKSVGKEIEVVEVEIHAQDEDEYITYKRTLPFRITTDQPFEKTADEKFTVTVAKSTGDPKVYEDKKETIRFVDKYMPEKIREYFYFDGEQLNNYFITNRKGKVRDAIFSISQVDIVQLVFDRIETIIKAKQKEAAAKAPNIKNITDELSTVDSQIDDFNKKIKDYDDQIAKSERIIKENTEYLQGEENLPELEKQYQYLIGQQTDLTTEKKTLMDSIFSFVREMKISLTFHEAAKRTLEIITKKEAEKTLPTNLDIPLLKKALKEHTCSYCNQSLSEREVDFIQRLIDSFNVSSAASHLLMGIKNELERIIDSVERYPIEKKALQERYQRNKKQLDDIESELADVDRRINRVSDKEEVKQKHNEREDHKELLDINKGKLAVANDALSKTLDKKSILEKDLAKALTKDKECSRINQLIEFATKSRNIVGNVQREMMDEVRKKMEERTTEYFTRLIWKKDTYDRIVLNEEFQLDLIHKAGYSCVATCSAAERCLLALSFTLALHEVSGFNSLLFIDTPVARISDINRVNFANVLCEVSKNKEIIMTFTPDEYSPEIKKIFDPAAKTNIKLDLVDEKVTVIKGG